MYDSVFFQYTFNLSKKKKKKKKTDINFYLQKLLFLILQNKSDILTNQNQVFSTNQNIFEFFKKKKKEEISFINKFV